MGMGMWDVCWGSVGVGGCEGVRDVLGCVGMLRWASLQQYQ